MGARQSVAQPSRQRNQSNALSNGQSQNGPSTSQAPAASTTTGFIGLPSRVGSGGSLLTRTSRSLSVPVPGTSSSVPALDSQQDSSDSENETGPGGGGAPLSLGGIPSLEQLLSRPRTRQSSARYSHNLPIAFRFFDIKCPVCNKTVPSDDAECHLVMCMTRPRITYNEDVLSEDPGAECVICLEEMVQGDTIARLPCLCIYHKTCIDAWFAVKNTCPEHPGDDD